MASLRTRLRGLAQNIVPLYSGFALGITVRQTLALADTLRETRGHEEGIVIGVLPWPNIGDAYYVARMLIASDDSDKTVIATYSERARIVLEQCGLCAALLSERQIRKLVKASYLLGEMQSGIRVLHYGPAYNHFSITRNLLGFHGTTYYDLIADCVFRDTVPAVLSYPVFGEPAERPKGSAKMRVLVNPHSNTLVIENHEFWIHLIARLVDVGFEVVVNSDCGMYKQLDHVVLFKPPLEDIGCLLDECACVIMIRSGFSDLIATSKVRKIVLYPLEEKTVWGVGSPQEAWTLAGIDFANELVEIELCSTNAVKSIDEIVATALRFREDIRME